LTEPWCLRTLVVPIDFSECSRRALELARFFATEAGPAHVILIHAYFMPVELETLAEEAHEPILDMVSQRATEDLERILVELQDEGISAEFAAHRGSPERTGEAGLAGSFRVIGEQVFPA
jgi:nucleotide-binding universal stress UspA family protein